MSEPINSDRQELFAVLAIDKPAGITSRDCVNHIQRLLRGKRRSDIPKIGHTGTLDPMATGVLLIALGKATRLVEFSHLQRKRYLAEFLLGQTSDTLDTEGQVVQLEDPPIIQRETWLKELSNWRGSIRQTPPQYSACKVDGKRAYELARQGVEFELASREVFIHQLELIDFEYPRVSMSIDCSSGTYIRSLGHDIATALGSAAVMSKLQRTSVGVYELSACCQLDDLRSGDDVRQAATGPLGLVAELPRIEVSSSELQRLRNGQILRASDHSNIDVTAEVIVAVDAHQQLVAILQRRADSLQPVRVFL
ncbi:MAG: tRNA pseudouridine(55) synthase TruB [Pirellulales bacterium]